MATLTTLIPAYKKEHLAEMFVGLARQTFRDFKVIVSDDSPGDEITAMVRDGAFGRLTANLDLQVVRGPKNARLNYQHLLDLWNFSSPYVHMQLDDDAIYPDFYRTHLAAHATGLYGVSVSRRWITQDDIRPVHGINLPRCVAESPLLFVPVHENDLFSSMVPTCNNWVGEFSNMVMSAAGASRFPTPPATGLSYYGWPDVGFLLESIQHQPMVYIRDHLSIFRQHAQQSTNRVINHSGRVSGMAWIAAALHAWQEQRISYAEAVNAIMYTVGECLRKFGEDDPVINEMYDIVQQHGASLAALHARFTPYWLRVLASHPSTDAATYVPAAERARPELATA
jgi:hypothetical protein